MPRRCRRLSPNCVTKHRLPSTFCNDLIAYYANKWYQSEVTDWLHGADDLEEGEAMVVLVGGGLLSERRPERARFLTRTYALLMTAEHRQQRTALIAGVTT